MQPWTAVSTLLHQSLMKPGKLIFFEELNRATELAKHTRQIADLTAETMQTNISALTDLDVHDQFANAPLSQLRPPPFWSWGRVGDLKENSKYTNV